MINTRFPKNPLLVGMEFKYEVLTLYFVKGKEYKLRKYRCEGDDNKSLAYKLFYSKTGQKVVDIFNNEIKDKLKVLSVE